MADKKKMQRASARLTEKKKASLSTKVAVNESLQVETASPHSAESDDASSTSGDLRQFCRDFEAEQNKEKAQLAKKLMHANETISGGCSSKNEENTAFSYESPLGAQLAMSSGQACRRSVCLNLEDGEVAGDGRIGLGPDFGARGTSGDGPTVKLGDSLADTLPDVGPVVRLEESTQCQNYPLTNSPNQMSKSHLDNFPLLQRSAHKIDSLSTPLFEKNDFPRNQTINQTNQENQTSLITEEKRRVAETPLGKQSEARRQQEPRNDWRKPLWLGFRPTSSDPKN